MARNKNNSNENYTNKHSAYRFRQKAIKFSLGNTSIFNITITIAVITITTVIPLTPVNANNHNNINNNYSDTNRINNYEIWNQLMAHETKADNHGNDRDDDRKEKNDENIVLINKCCLRFEIHLDGACQQVNESDYFTPVVTKMPEGEQISVKYKFVIGLPACGSMQIWPINDYAGSSDKLVLLPDGKLRHYTNSKGENGLREGSLEEYGDYADETQAHTNHYDYDQGKYCIDKAISTKDPHGVKSSFLFANICFAKKEEKWSDTNFLITKVLNTIFHISSLIMLLIIAIVYFVLPTLRDLVGNIITSIALCLMVSQMANLVRTFTEFTNHVSFMVADIILYFSLLGAFLWLNSFGYYIWKTFRSRNVFLRVTDGRKYCYYSVYVWCTTAFMAGLAIFAHFFLDADSYKKENLIAEQETIGWLGVAVFFAPIACTIIIDIFFYVTTLKLINRRNVYGRIQHKLKAHFIMFALVLLVMSVSWLFLTLTWLKLDGLLYVYIIVNAVQAPLLFYICIMRQHNVTFLLKKSCCYNEPPSVNDWGDEMYYMNSNDY